MSTLRATALALLLALALLAGAAGPARAQVSREDLAALEQARDLQEKGKHAESVRVLERLIERTPTLADAHRLLGHAYFALERKDDARAAFGRALAQGRLTADVLGRLVQIDREREARASVLSLLRLLAIVDPTEKTWQVLYADTLAREGLLDEAERLYERLLDEEPWRGQLHLRVGNLRLARGRTKEAALALEMAYRLGERTRGLERTVAGLQAEMGDAAGALDWFERALAAEPERGEELALQCGRLAVDLGDGAAARRRLGPLLESADRERARHAARLLLKAARAEGDAAASAALLKKLAVLGDEDPKLCVALGMEALEAGAHREAADWLARAIAAGEDGREVRAAATRAFVRAAEREKARAALTGYLARHGLTGEAAALIHQYRAAFDAGAADED